MSSELLDDLDYLDQKAPKQVYVGFWKRLGATILDSVALSIILVFLGALTGLLALILPTSVIDFLQSVGSIVVVLLYLPLWESSSSQGSIGKQILGIKVVNKDGKRLSFWRALARFVAKWVSYMIFCMGFLMIAGMDKKRGLHDLIANTYVIER
jgi:uncharacterized RDD family membrane protein YckC